MADEQIPSTSATPPAAEAVDDDVEDLPYVKRHLYSGEVLQMWNLARVIRQLGTRDQCVNFAVSEGLVLASKECRRHRKPMSIYTTNHTVGAFVCNKASCRTTSRVSRATGTWFEGAKLTLPQIFYITYCFAYSYSYDKVIHEDPTRDENNECLSRVTVCNWYNYCREVVVLYQIDHQEKKGKIGGPGKIVQIDESKFGKRKYNKGRRIEGHFVLGLIEHGSEDLRLEVCSDNVRSAEVLIPLIQKHVAEGTTIHIDFWKEYVCLTEYGYIHKSPEDGTHTQRIDSQWRVVKRFFNKKNYFHTSNFADLIFEYSWRREMSRKKRDVFVELLNAIKYTYKVCCVCV